MGRKRCPQGTAPATGLFDLQRGVGFSWVSSRASMRDSFRTGQAHARLRVAAVEEGDRAKAVNCRSTPGRGDGQSNRSRCARDH